MKNIVKFKHEEKEGFLSVVVKDDIYFTLVEKTTPKVKTAKTEGKLLISFDIKHPNYEEVHATVVEDMDIVKQVYEQLENDKNLYFKSLTDDLCVIKFNK
ncbi:hypothetical protein BK011_00530 [Tenericutes bacterium MZ-XQ]|jgi:hypothetical protein|nr:hypothetical protein BK011_00530 [Tenericutes bacterium MZ-XQ]